MKFGPAVAFVGVIAAALLTAAMLLTAGWSRPPVHAEQFGYRGVAMGQITDPRAARLIKYANSVPEPLDPAPATGKKARAEYKNVKVLGDLSVDQFNRVMLAITAWVSPDQGCAYCHNTDNLADDGLYTKIVARRMLQLTRHVNTDWKAHVASTGVTCYTCHRGAPVPSNVWFNGPNAPHAGGFAADTYGMGHPTRVNDSTALPSNALAPYLDKDDSIRVSGKTALPGGFGASIQTTEKTFSLMIHMSESLGVNCTYCHNSRAFPDWSQSSPARATAWQGLQMVRDVNDNYLDPLKGVLPASRLGPQGDAPKADCATCHQGVAIPLLGASMAKDYPELGGAPAQK
jgi:photosynthetic reaction center cytochrome c subunit